RPLLRNDAAHNRQAGCPAGFSGGARPVSGADRGVASRQSQVGGRSPSVSAEKTPRAGKPQLQSKNVRPPCSTNVCPVASNSSWMSSGAPPVAALHSYDSAATRAWQLSALAIPAAAAMPASDSSDTVFANLLIASPFAAFPPHVV